MSTTNSGSDDADVRLGDEMDQVDERLKGIEKAKTFFERWARRKADWDDPNDVLQYRTDDRRRKRTEALDALVPTRECPLCDRLVFESRGWVISKSGRTAVCRSCYFRNFGVPGRTVNLPVTLFPSSTQRFYPDRVAIRTARRRSGLSRREFSRRAGWSHTYQGKIENGEVSALTKDAVVTILTVLQEAGVNTRDYLT